jgi:hypothetical protein
MLLLYAARIEDLRAGDFVKLDCTICAHVALLTRERLLKAGLPPPTKVLDLKGRAAVLRVREEGRAVSGGTPRGAGRAVSRASVTRSGVCGRQEPAGERVPRPPAWLGVTQFNL